MVCPHWLSQGHIFQAMIQKMESASLETGGVRGKEGALPHGSLLFYHKKTGHALVSESAPTSVFVQWCCLHVNSVISEKHTGPKG